MKDESKKKKAAAYMSKPKAVGTIKRSTKDMRTGKVKESPAKPFKTKPISQKMYSK